MLIRDKYQCEDVFEYEQNPNYGHAPRNLVGVKTRTGQTMKGAEVNVTSPTFKVFKGTNIMLNGEQHFVPRDQHISEYVNGKTKKNKNK